MKTIKHLLLVMASMFLLASCGKDPMPKDIRFSVLGDSYSTFKGYVDPESNDVWYCPPPYNNIDVTSIEDMWWHKVATTMGWTLEKNNSFSGSLISNFWGYNSGPYYAPHSFIRRMDDLGDPDVIFVFGGTNDVWNGAYSGEFVYYGWTEGQLEQYRPALAYLFDHLVGRYPEAKIYFLVDMDFSADDNQRFVLSAQIIARRYGICCIDLYDIQKDWAHPNAQGMSDIAAQVVAVLRQSY